MVLSQDRSMTNAPKAKRFFKKPGGGSKGGFKGKGKRDYKKKA